MCIRDSFMPGSVFSGSTSWDDCGRMFPDLLRVSALVNPLRFCWVKGVCLFRFNLPPAVLAEWSGSFTYHCGNTGVERKPNKSQHTRLTLEKNFSRRSCRDSNWHPFDHESGALTNKLTWHQKVQLKYRQKRSGRHTSLDIIHTFFFTSVKKQNQNKTKNKKNKKNKTKILTSPTANL